MSLCVWVAGKTLLFSAATFTLSWTHSVEKVTWQEDWQVTSSTLVLAMARVKGSGAGMEPGEGASLKNGWWEWYPQLPPQTELYLAASGTTGGGWELCLAKSACLKLPEKSTTPIRLWSCEGATK